MTVGRIIYRWEIALCEAINSNLLEDYAYELSGLHEKWPTMLRPLLTDNKLTSYLRRWVVEGKGVEEFPTDPLVPENWEENAKKSSNI